MPVLRLFTFAKMLWLFFGWLHQYLNSCFSIFRTKYFYHSNLNLRPSTGDIAYRMSTEENDKQQRRETKLGIVGAGNARDRLLRLEQHGIPEEYSQFEDLREEVHILLDHLLIAEKIELETSHLIRSKLRRISEFYMEMETESRAGSDDKWERDKETQDSKLEVVQLMLSQLFPKLKQYIH